MIGLANWTPDGFVGQMFKTIGEYAPPAPGLIPPSLWGTREEARRPVRGAEAKIRAHQPPFQLPLTPFRSTSW